MELLMQFLLGVAAVCLGLCIAVALVSGGNDDFDGMA